MAKIENLVEEDKRKTTTKNKKGVVKRKHGSTKFFVFVDFLFLFVFIGFLAFIVFKMVGI